MKRIILLFLICSVCNICIHGQNKKFDKLIKEYDVIQYLNNLPDRNPKTFWDAVWRNNERLSNLLEAIQKKKSSAIEAKKTLYKAKLLSDSYCNQFIPVEKYNEILNDTIYKTLGVKQVFPEFSIEFIYGKEINAFTVPEGKVFINSGLVELDGMTIENLFGIVAHEVTHFILQHSFEEAYKVQKKLKTNKIIAGISSTVSIASTAWAQANSPTGNENEWNETWNNVNEQVVNLFEDAKNDATGRYRYKYSRGQEFEADIIAYRFLDFIGIGGQNYIEALKRIETPDSDIELEDSTHPTTKERIELLEYVSNKK